MQTQIQTVEDFKSRCSPVIESFRFNKNYQVHLIEPPQAGTPFDLIGAYGYRTADRPTYEEQHFLLTINDNLRHKDGSLVELTALMRMAASIERRLANAGVQVLDVRLPKCHGFSGVKYGYRQVLELFPHLK